MATPVVLKALLDLSDGAEFDEASSNCFDISTIVMTAHTRRGRNKELDKIESGYSVITVLDDNGDFNPDNADSPYYGKLKPGNKLRLYPLYDDGTGEFRYPDIFTGYITNYLNRFSMGVNSANEVVIEANDAFKIFNSYSITTDVVNSTSGDSSDERIGAILDEISWPAGLRTFETSALSLGADAGDLRTILDAIRQVEDTEVGLFYIDGSGVAQFKNRTTVNVSPNIDDAYIFSDDGIETGYNGITFSQNDNTLINRVTVRSYDGTNEVTVYNSTSEISYFSRSAERNNVLVTSTSDLTDLANQLLTNFKDSNVNIESIVLNLTDYEQIDRIVAALYFDIFFIPIAVSKTMPNDTILSRLGWVQGVNHDITKSSWLVTAFTGLTEPAPLYWLNETGSYLTFAKVFSDTTKAIYGEAMDSNTDLPLGLIKFDSAGNLIWQKKFYLSTNSASLAKNFRIDSNDNLYGFYQTYLWKISSSGSEIWTKDMNLENSFIENIDIDSNGNVYCILELGGVVALDSSGDILWQIKTYDNTAPDGDIDYLNDIKVTDSAIYLTGSILPYEANFMGLIVKLDLDGNLIWRYKIDSGTTLTTLLQAGICINTTNNYIYTAINSSANDGTSIFTLEDAGATLSIVSQARYADSIIQLLDRFTESITLDNNGNHLICLKAEGISLDPYISLALDDSSTLTRSFTIFNGVNPAANSESLQTIQVYSANKSLMIYGGKRVIGKFPPSISFDKTLNAQTVKMTQVTESLSSASWTLSSDVKSLETVSATIDDFTSSNQDLSYTFTLFNI